MLEVSAQNLMRDTREHLIVRYTYDLDFSGPFRRLEPDSWLLVRLPQAHPLLTEYDKLHETHVLGECDTTLRTVFLVPERLETPVRWVHVAMHETLHAT